MTKSIIATYPDHTATEAAVKELQKGGFDMKKLSIVGRDYHSEEHVVGYYNTGDRTKYWGKMGAFWGGIWGWFFGSAFFLIPGIGPLLVAGPLVAWIVGALEAAAVIGGVSAIGAGLYSIGIPRDSVIAYEAEVTADSFLVMVHCAREDVAYARTILAAANARRVDVHSDTRAPEPADGFVPIGA